MKAGSASPSFYGLQPLVPADIDFFLTVPEKDREGAFMYEFQRQLYARALAGRFWRELSEGDLSELRAWWLKTFSKPWSEIHAGAKEWFRREWRKRDEQNHLAWRHARPGETVEDPAPWKSGDLVLLKIDWDLSDAQIEEWFRRSLRIGRPRPHIAPVKKPRKGAPEFSLSEVFEPMRPRPPRAMRRESTADMLRAIAMQRVFDCRGSSDPVPFAMRYLDGILPGKDQLEISLQRIDEGKERFRILERDCDIVNYGKPQGSPSPFGADPDAVEHYGFGLAPPLTGYSD